MNSPFTRSNPADLSTDIANERQCKHYLEIQNSGGSLRACVYMDGLNGPRSDTLLVFFHGGAFVGGSVDDFGDTLTQLVCGTKGLVALSSAYTLAHVRPFPQAIEDAYAVLLWATKNKARIAWSGKRLIVAGFEAGGNLAAVVCHLARDRGGPRLAGQVLIMPMLDPGLTSCSMRELPACRVRATFLDEYAGLCAAGYHAYLPNPVDRIHPYASPLQSSRLKGLPPALILYAHNDPLRDEAIQYAEKLRNNGVATTLTCLPWPTLEPCEKRSDIARACGLHEIAEFLQSNSAHQAPKLPY